MYIQLISVDVHNYIYIYIIEVSWNRGTPESPIE